MNVALHAWLAAWRALARYHRYTVSGFEHIDRRDAVLIAGYHGRPIAFDLCMLSAHAHDRLGYLPHGIGHRDLGRPRWARAWLRDLGALTGDDDALAEVVARGEHIIVAPGGIDEGMRHSSVRYRVDWGDHLGYLRLAARHRLPIVPAAASGVDDCFYGVDLRGALGTRSPAWLGVGATGVFPLSLPWPAKIHQRLGAPIVLPPDLDVTRRESLWPWHLRVTERVQALLDEARGVSQAHAVRGAAVQ